MNHVERAASSPLRWRAGGVLYCSPAEPRSAGGGAVSVAAFFASDAGVYAAAMCATLQ